ncbi:MAG: cysteine desulfurase [Deltaproteobacteria bacterium]|nr:MAG: cysteine desulfurase [Deltaproteobacteria bacterium]
MDAVYLDNAATTRVAAGVADVVVACLREDYGNPSSAHAAGIAAARRVKTARAALLAALGDEDAGAGDVYFTSGGTEADAIGTIGAARARRGRHLLCSAIEHPAVLESLALLESDGWQVDRIPVTRDGVIDLDRAATMLRDDTAVVAVMLVNNEIGTIQPVADLARAVRDRCADAHVHCDAVQALGKIPIDVRALGVDSVAVSAHKLHGPKGVGALWLRRGARVRPLWAGGGQQRGVRSGTENVPGIAGFGEAARLATADLAAQGDRWRTMRQQLVDALRTAGVAVRENAAGAPRAPHIASLAIDGAPAEPLLHALEARGVLVSAGSACASRHKGPSHVLRAIRVPDRAGTLRVSFGRDTTFEQVTRAAEVLVDVLRDL